MERKRAAPRRLSSAWLAAVGAMSVLAAALPARAADVKNAASTRAEDFRHQAVDALFAEFNQPGSPGAAIGIYRSGRADYLRGYGHANLEDGAAFTPRTRFMVASVSKQFTAFAIALLAREGKVDLDADIRAYLPYVPDFGHSITARHLLHHTSGLREILSLEALIGQGPECGGQRQQRALNMVARQRALNFAPGSTYFYNNTGYALLAELVRAVSGRTLRQFTTERMFQPLGMSNTVFADDVTQILPDRAHSYRKGEDGTGWRRMPLDGDDVGWTGLWTTAEDLLEWAANFVRPRVGDAALIEQIGAPGTLQDGTPVNYGFGLQRQTFAGHESITHTGGVAGYSAIFTYFPAHDFSVVLLMNTLSDSPRDWSASVEARIEAIVELYLNAGVERAAGGPPATIAPQRALLQALAGHYLGALDVPDDGHKMVSLTQEGNTLVWRTFGSDSTPLVFRADGSFDLGVRTWDYYRPRRDERGRVVAIEHVSSDQHGRTTLYRRVKPVSPSRDALAELEGDYRSPELDVTYTFTVEQGRLTARALATVQPLVFAPASADRFDSTLDEGMATIVIERNSRGEVAGLKVYDWGASHVLFERVQASTRTF